jgi:hypothetical protein
MKGYAQRIFSPYASLRYLNKVEIQALPHTQTAANL